MKALIPVSIALVPLTAACCAAAARWMRRRRVGQSIRELGPQGHAVKAGTPTMGGLCVLCLWVIAVLAFSASTAWTRSAGFVLTAGVLHGAIGLLDDVRAVRRRRSLGLSARWKLVLGSAAAVVLFVLFRDVVSVPQRIPFARDALVLPPMATFALVWISLLATTNSANLTDGLDGLAGGVTALVLVGLVALSPTEPVALLGVPLIATLLGFLWINVHPAGIFLGDVGSFGVGAVIAAIALATGTAFFLPLVAGVLVIEAGSVLLQVTSYRVTGVRLFRMAPLHHHFEASTRARSAHVFRGFDWPEPRITVRFWLVQALFVGLAVWAARAA